VVTPDRKGHAHDEPHVVSVGIYLVVFATLMIMTGVTVLAATQDFGPFNAVVALGIAVFKATLVILFFMHVKYSPRLTQIVVGAAFLWLLILILGTLHDYYSPRVQGPERVPDISRQ
jgi:cytochrome c oxidase subunit IV